MKIKFLKDFIDRNGTLYKKDQIINIDSSMRQPCLTHGWNDYEDLKWLVHIEPLPSNKGYRMILIPPDTSEK